MDQLKEMIGRDISEKEHIKNLLHKMEHLFSKISAVQVITIVIGFFLVVVIGLDIYLNAQLLEQIKKNGRETLTNRSIGGEILQKLESIEKK